MLTRKVRSGLRPLESFVSKARQQPCSKRSSSSSANVASAEAVPGAEKAKKATDFVGIAVFSGICLGTFGLGSWQVKRYFWRVKHIQEIKARAAEPPAPFDADAIRRAPEDWVGKVVALRGRFDHANEVVLGLRSAPVSVTGGAAQGMAQNPQGYFLLCPFVLEGSGETVFVNRGWVPKDMVDAKDESSRGDWERPAGVEEVLAVVAHEEKKGTFTPKNDASSKKLLWLALADLIEATNKTAEFSSSSSSSSSSPSSSSSSSSSVPSSSSSLPTSPILLDCVSTAAPAKPRNGPEVSRSVVAFPAAKDKSDLEGGYMTPVTHLTYAVTWYLLSAAGFIMTYSKFKLQRRRIRVR